MYLLNVLKLGGWTSQACAGAGGACDGSISEIISKALGAIGSLQGMILAVCVSLAVLMVAYGGILLLTSAGNPQAVKKGKDSIMWGVVGLVVVIYAYQIISWVFLIIKGQGPELAGTAAGAVSIILNALFGILGLVAVVVVLIGGINMMISTGDPGRIRKSKDTLMWGLIGLVICIFASAIVNFVIGMIAK